MVLRGSLMVGITVCLCATAQVIEFDSNGLRYKTLTRSGVTVMFANLPVHIRDYAVVQIAVSNGSPVSWTIKPEDFIFQKSDGAIVQASPAQEVVISFIKHSSRQDVIKLVSTYEAGLYGNTHLKTTNGYEARRQNALAEVSSARLKAGAAASAIVLAPIKLRAGESTDGALFFEAAGKMLGPGHLRVHVAGETFDFELDE
jgi:hypothetical protein